MLKWIEIDRKIVESNIKIIKSQLNKNVKFMAVVKANGYGHGAVEISKIALKNGADLLGVLTAYEGAELRKAGIKSEIMILSPSLEEEIDIIIKNKLIPNIDRLEFLLTLEKKKISLKFNLDIDSGLKRWGIDANLLDIYLKKIQELKYLKFYSISTHIAYTPYRNMTEAHSKLEFFSKLVQKAKSKFPNILAHAANSLILCDFKEFQLDMVRIGNLIYGIYPADIYKKKTKGPPLKGIKRPWKFCTKIVSIKEVKEGESFGYASEIVAIKNMKIASIPVGYSDGLTLEPQDNSYKITEGSKYWGIINGKKAPFVSRSAISNTLLDITDIPDAKIGTTVYLAIRRTAANYKIPRIYK